MVIIEGNLMAVLIFFFFNECRVGLFYLNREPSGDNQRCLDPRKPLLRI